MGCGYSHPGCPARPHILLFREMQTWNEVLSGLHCAGAVISPFLSFLNNKRSCCKLQRTVVFVSPPPLPPIKTTALSAVVNHSFLTMTTLEKSLRPEDLQPSYFQQSTSMRKLFLLLLYGPAGKWKQMSSTTEQLFYCYEPSLRLFTWLYRGNWYPGRGRALC